MARKKTIKYQGYQINTSSFRQEGRWVPRASVKPLDESQNPEERPLTWQKKFETKEKADAFAVEGAQLYIEENF